MSQQHCIDGHSTEYIPIVRELFLEYAQWLKVDLCFQDFATELKTLPGQYAPPAGAILLGYVDTELAGCVAMRPLAATVCEMKRLWVREPFRSQGIGRYLVETLLERAREAGYHAIRLDTLPQMHAAIALYERLGFQEIPAYYHNPTPGTLYLEKQLTDLA